MTIAKATAPLAAAWLHSRAHGYAGVFAATAAICLIAAASLIAVPRIATSGQRGELQEAQLQGDGASMGAGT
jgi:hypothetical protein